MSQTYLEAILTAKIKGRKQEDKTSIKDTLHHFMRGGDLLCSTQTLALHFTYAALFLVFLLIPPETPVHWHPAHEEGSVGVDGPGQCAACTGS